jgi:hypothetical protein
LTSFKLELLVMATFMGLEWWLLTLLKGLPILKEAFRVVRSIQPPSLQFSDYSFSSFDFAACQDAVNGLDFDSWHHQADLNVSARSSRWVSGALMNR